MYTCNGQRKLNGEKRCEARGARRGDSGYAMMTGCMDFGAIWHTEPGGGLEILDTTQLGGVMECDGCILK